MENGTYQMQGENFTFDTSGGISVDEQKEILDRINSLGVEKGIVPQEGLPDNAKKKGFVFPLAVNAAAALILAAGFAVLLFSFNRDDQDIREASAVLNITERKLIQEIRQETNRLLLEKEKAISDVLSRLADTGAEYQALRLSASLSDEQIERADQLLKLQDDYRDRLSVLQNERTNILEDSRFMELSLRTQAEDRLNELSGQIEEGSQDQLSRLSAEQDRAFAAEAQLGGYYTMLNAQITQGRNDEASGTISSIKLFLSSPLFSSSRSLESIRQNHLAAVSALENSIALSGGTGLSVSTEQLASLQQRIEEQDRTIAALSSEGSNQGSLAASYEQTIADLRSTNSSQMQQMSQLNETNGQLQSNVIELTQARNNLQQQIDSIPQIVQQAIETPSIQDQLGPLARQALQQIIVSAIQEAVH